LLELLLGVEYILLVENGVAELFMINGLTQIRLNTVLDDGHIKHLVHIWAQTLICIQQLGHKGLEFGREPCGKRVVGPTNDFHGQKVKTGCVKRGLLSTELIQDYSH